MTSRYSGHPQVSPARSSRPTKASSTSPRMPNNSSYYTQANNEHIPHGRPSDEHGYRTQSYNRPGYNGTPQGGPRSGDQFSRHTPYQKPKLATNAEWRAWPQIKVKITGLPQDCKSSEVFRLLNEKGTIDFIKMKREDADDNPGRRCVAFVTFIPPPHAAFWDQGHIGVTRSGTSINAELYNDQHVPECKSPKHPAVVFPEIMVSGPDSGPPP